MFYNAIFMVAMVTFYGATADHTPPACGDGFVCPSYTLVESNEDYEVRDYSQSKWVVTSNESGSGAFMRLFYYITGSNEAGLKIPMTIPVLKKHLVNTDTQSVTEEAESYMFYLDGATPDPTDPDVSVLTLPAFRAYVKSFGGYSSSDVIQNTMDELRDALPDDVTVVDSYLYRAGYDAPWKFFNRHNEVWLVQ